MNLAFRERDFLTLLDYSESELRALLDYAIQMKLEFKAGKAPKLLDGKTLAMLFEKSSTRTRVSFEVGMTQLGGHAIFLDMNTMQLGRGETIADTARTLSRYCDCIMARLYKHSNCVELAEFAEIPVINGLTDLFHPCQTTADLMTVFEKKGDVKGLRVVFLGDCGFNMFNSTMIGFSKLGADVVGICPEKKEYNPSPEILGKARAQAKGSISIEHDVNAVKDADVIHVDTWVSMGQENAEQRISDLTPYQLNASLLSRAKKDCLVMHCLPAHRGHEITDEVIDGSNSVVWQQAENRLHAQKAILVALNVWG